MIARRGERHFIGRYGQFSSGERFCPDILRAP
jgi:hypothetical protein